MQTKLFVNNLTIIDCSYLDASIGLTGMSWHVDVELLGELDHQGMIFDFGLVKKNLKKVIDQQLDHRLLVPAQMPGLEISESNDQIDLLWQKEAFGTIRHSSPPQAVAILGTDQITEAYLSQILEEMIRIELPDNVMQVHIKLVPEHIVGPCFQYSHGLKKHMGACQRIAHGHRSRLAIYGHNEFDCDLMKAWCDDFHNIYIGTREDLQTELHIDDILHYQFSYESQEGHFSLTLPEKCCYLIDTESTIENIAHHILSQLLLAFPDEQWIVKVFEGINKGAIATNAIE